MNQRPLGYECETAMTGNLLISRSTAGSSTLCVGAWFLLLFVLFGMSWEQNGSRRHDRLRTPSRTYVCCCDERGRDRDLCWHVLVDSWRLERRFRLDDELARWQVERGRRRTDAGAVARTQHRRLRDGPTTPPRLDDDLHRGSAGDCRRLDVDRDRSRSRQDEVGLADPPPEAVSVPAAR